MRTKLIFLLVAIFLCLVDSEIYGIDENKSDIDNEISREKIEVELQVRWKEMITALARGDIERALTYFVAASRDRYRKEFTSRSNIVSIFLSMKELKLYSVDEHAAECGAIRVENGKTFSYPVVFVRDENGIWKIMGF